MNLIRLKNQVLLAFGAMFFFGISLSNSLHAESLTSIEKLPSAKKGGTLLLSIMNNPKVMNPLLDDDSVSAQMTPLLFASLCLEETETLKLLPYLVSKFDVSKDKKTYTFYLREAAKWEDQTPVTVEDVQFTFDSLMDPKVNAAAQRAYWVGIQFQKVDQKTFRFVQPNPQFDTLRSLCYFRPVQKKAFEGGKDYNQAKTILNPVSNGPYRLASFQRDQRIVFERVKNWWGFEVPHSKNRNNIDKLSFAIVGDTNLEYEKLLKNEIDFMKFEGGTSETFATKVRGADQAKFGKKRSEGKPLWESEIFNKAPRGYTYVGWNLRLPIFQSKKTRQALSYLANYEEIFKKVYFSLYDRCISPFGSKTMNSDQSLWAKKPVFDVKKALSMLKEDGWSDSDRDGVLDKDFGGKRVPFRFTLKFNSNNQSRAKISQILKEDFKKAGIDIQIQAMEWNAFLSDIDTRKFETVLLAWTATPYPNPRQTWHTDAEKEQGSNFIGYSNPKVDELTIKANAEFDLKKRALILHQINRILFEDQPYLFLAEPQSLAFAIHKRISSPTWAMAYDVSLPSDLFSVSE